MSSVNHDWVEELFLILDIPITKKKWQNKFDETMYSLKNEVQFMVSTLNNNEQQLIQEAEKRVTSYYLNGFKSTLTTELKVVASEILLRNQQPELALTVLQPIDMDASADYFINFGRALMQIGILDQAKQSFITALDKDPESAEPLFHLAFHAGISGDLRASAKLYRESLEHDPDHIGSLMNLAYLSFQLEEIDNAIRYAEQVIKADETMLGGYLVICSCLNASRQFEKSAETIARARNIFGETEPDIDELEAIVCFEQSRYSRAVKLVTRYIEARPTAMDLRYVRLKSNIELENWDEALADIDELLSLEPFDTECLEMRFRALFSANRWEEAELAYIKLLENSPQMRIKYTKEYATLRKNLAIVIG
ncbi:tetratricopeptide repeat protein [Vibrio sp. HN007]|uniref:tetratricopeptide repeat protein n=1 Tax=Vibrio iocasae TaxID=3098914 RepID=UPI0035D4B054